MAKYTTRELMASALEYAANQIDSDTRRGVFVKAFVEGEDWAERDLMNHLDLTEPE